MAAAVSNEVVFEFPNNHTNNDRPHAALATPMILHPVIRIQPFHDTFTLAEADAWYQNAIRLFRAQLAAREIFGNNSRMYKIKSILIHLVVNILPELIMNSFYKKGELKALNKANAINKPELDRLIRNIDEQFVRHRGKLEEMKVSMKPKLAHKTENLIKIAARLESLEEHRNARVYALAERDAERRGILYSRQQPYIDLVDKVITEADYLINDETTEMLNFIHGLIPYFQKKQIHVKSDEAYVHFRDQFARILSSLAGVLTKGHEEASVTKTRGQGKLRRQHRITRRRHRHSHHRN